MQNVPANIVVITQNVIIDSLREFAKNNDRNITSVIVSTQHLFPFEKSKIESFFGVVEFKEFADLLTDLEMEECDIEAYKKVNQDVIKYYAEIKAIKNRRIIKKIQNEFNPIRKYVVCDDLGIDVDEWVDNGYERIYAEYYYVKKPENNQGIQKKNRIITSFKNILANRKLWNQKSIYSSLYHGKKYIFFGEMHRIGYRLNGDFKLDKRENRQFFYDYYLSRIFGRTIPRKDVIRFSTLHESVKWQFPQAKNYTIFLTQDGYLPPNYSSYYLKFVPNNVVYYAWDKLGEQLFINQGINVEMIPIRKKLYLPGPVFKPLIKKVLIVASGAGDWTALKNRSDDDRLVELFGEVAKRYPSILFIFRCHPTWIHPQHQGVNSINRVIEYYKTLGIKNIKVSSNIPSSELDNFKLSYSRSSLDEDLVGTDLVFGEHSVSMIDAAFKKIPFASVNVTGRRDFFCGMTELGFPHLESIDEVINFLNEFDSATFQQKYLEAVKNYNRMTDEE